MYFLNFGLSILSLNTCRPSYMMLSFDAYDRKDLWRLGKITLRKVLQRG